MVTAMRVLAQFIDIVVYFVIMILSLLYLLPAITYISGSHAVSGLVVFLLTILIYFAMQYPFYTNFQTIGKSFFGLYIQPKGYNYGTAFKLVFIREVFIKLMSCYVLCIPVIWGYTGFHEKSTNTEIIFKSKKRR